MQAGIDALTSFNITTLQISGTTGVVTNLAVKCKIEDDCHSVFCQR